MGFDFLSAADDLLTSALLDHVVFALENRKTGKMNPDKEAAIHISEQDQETLKDLVVDLRDAVIHETDAVDKFCETQCAVDFMLKWPSQMQSFRIHVRRYMIALGYDSGLAFHETDRYTRPLAAIYPTPSPTPSNSSTPVASPPRRVSPFIDVAVFSTRFFKKGETIELRGGTAKLSDEQDDQMREDGNKVDFSVIWSEREKCFALLLGPARFVNHDCRSNVEFIHSGKNMMFKVMEDIQPNEQLFTDYGDNYFEDDNAACLCSTCEQFGQGAFNKLRVNAPVPLSKPLSLSVARTFLLPHLSSPAASTSALQTSPRRAIRAPKPLLDPSLSLTAPPKLRQNVKAPSSRSTTPASIAELRRSERAVIDMKRMGKRLVHPALEPPTGYDDEYEWDEEKREAVFMEMESEEEESDSDSSEEEDNSSDENDGSNISESDDKETIRRKRSERHIHRTVERKFIAAKTTRRVPGQRLSKRISVATRKQGGRWDYGDSDGDADDAEEEKHMKKVRTQLKKKAIAKAALSGDVKVKGPRAKKTSWVGYYVPPSGDENESEEEEEEEKKVDVNAGRSSRKRAKLS